MLTSIMMILLSLSHADDSVGFSSGKTFTATVIEGQVTVICSGFNGNGQGFFNCRDLTLDPVTHDYFVGPKNAQATKVDLTAVHQDGNSLTKTLNYQGAQGKSKDRVNLWIATLFQRPLLDRGLNKLHYVMYGQNSKELSQGDFEVMVERGTPRKCEPAMYSSNDLNDCHSQFSICQRYFQESNYCQ